VWERISLFLYDELGRPDKVLDPAAGRGEFIRSVPSQERGAVDQIELPEGRERAPTRTIVGDVLDAELPDSHFDAVLVSNFLEHLASPDEVAAFLEQMRSCLRAGGRIAVMGPNYRYCADEYWDCADHRLALTHVTVEEHLYAARFALRKTVPRFLPYSFRGALPASARLADLYLRTPAAWRLLGKQFLVLAER
jgi:SAM-dependent methyltransferase